MRMDVVTKRIEVYCRYSESSVCWLYVSNYVRCVEWVRGHHPTPEREESMLLAPMLQVPSSLSLERVRCGKHP